MKRIINRYCRQKSEFLRLLKSRWSWKRLIAALCLSLLIIVADYYVSNMTSPIFDSSIRLGYHAFARDSKVSDDLTDDFMMVNIAWDKSTGVVFDEFNDSAGYMAVTDRQKLYDFLKLASEVDYRYIFLDIRFEKNVLTPYDSLLYSQIESMPRVLYSCHQTDDDDLIEYVKIPDKYAIADYRVAKGDPFSRYQFLYNNSESIALKLYSDIDGQNIVKGKLGTYYTSDGSLCYNVQFIPFPLSATNKYGPMGEIIYPCLGSQLKKYHPNEELKQMMIGKVIVIGDFYEDMHETFVGDIPGPLFPIYAWKLLQRGGHKVNILLQLVLFALYTLVIYILLLPKDLKQIKNPLVSMVLSFLGWGFVLFLLQSALFWICGLSFIIIIPSFIFSVIKFYQTINDNLKYKK